MNQNTEDAKVDSPVTWHGESMLATFIHGLYDSIIEWPSTLYDQWCTIQLEKKLAGIDNRDRLRAAQAI